MNYGTYGFDPAMVNDADRIFMLVVETMFNQGQIDANVMNALKGQYGTYKSSIINDVMTKAAQANRTPDQQMIQESIHGFVSNVIQSYANRPQMATVGGYGSPIYAGYGMGYGQPAYGGYGQPTYAGYQTGTLYVNPLSQAGYSQPVYGGGYRGGCMPQTAAQATAAAAVTASRYSTMPPAAPQAPSAPAQNNVFEQRTPAVAKVEYNSPMVLNTEEVTTNKFTGTKKTVRIGSEHMADVFVGKLTKPVLHFRDFMKRMAPLITSKNQFMMVAVQVPKLLKSKAREVHALLQQMATFLNKDMATSGTGLESIPGIFKRFYTEWIKESGDAQKELTHVLVDEVNRHLSCGYLFSGGNGRLKIDSLDDIFELYDKNTNVPQLKEWQKNPDYMSHLSAIVYHAVFSLFLGRNDYRVIGNINIDDVRLATTVFSDLEVDGFMVKDSFQAITKAITNAKIDPTTATAVPALNTTINDHAIILVPRVFVYTNLVPAGFVTGDYACPNIFHEVETVSNVLEDYLVAGFKALNNNGSTLVVQGVLCTNTSMYGFNVGTNASKHLFIGPSSDPVISF